MRDEMNIKLKQFEELCEDYEKEINLLKVNAGIETTPLKSLENFYESPGYEIQ